MVKVIDAPCGRGKTSWAIQYMNENQGGKYIFITPFLKEVDRIKKSCVGFREPKDTNGTKRSHFKELLAQEHNIVSTHSLFSMVDEETMDLIRLGGYTLILDEVMEVVKLEKVSAHDLEMLQNDGWLIVDKDTGKVTASEKAGAYNGQFKEIIQKAMADRLLCFKNTFLIWQFPPEIFGKFKETYVLTYLFHGQILRCYFDFHDIGYEMHSVRRCAPVGPSGGPNGDHMNPEGDPMGPGGTCRYQMIPYDPLENDRNIREWSRDHIHIYEGKLNDIGEASLSYSWHERNQNSKHLMGKLQKNTYNFFRGRKAGDNMWTTFRATYGQLKGKGYTKGFVQVSERATNEYRDKKNLAYLVNRFLNPGLTQYFQSRDVEVDQDLYAVSELIQWLWRSQLRDGKPVDLYVPSKRMRGLLRDWMEGTLEGVQKAPERTRRA